MVSLFPHSASFRFRLTVDTLAFGYILPTAGRIRVFHPIERALTGHTKKQAVICWIAACLFAEFDTLCGNLSRFSLEKLYQNTIKFSIGFSKIRSRSMSIFAEESMIQRKTGDKAQIGRSDKCTLRRQFSRQFYRQQFNQSLYTHIRRKQHVKR